MLKKIFLFLLLLPSLANAQYKLSVELAKMPTTHGDEEIFITGNFNKWQPAEKAMRLTKNAQGRYAITVNLKDVPSDRLEFKFTRGDWKTLECSKEGRLGSPRLALLNKDTTIVCNIEGWRDAFPSSTRSANVHRLDSAFYMPQLKRSRNVWIYLPQDYAISKKSYPVIYMQDGQHLFDEATSQGRTGPVEWGVDEVLDSVSTKAIIVAVDHNPNMKERVKEYYFKPNADQPEAEGKAYLDFVVKTLKPYIDKNYRTLPSKKHTAMAGSSMGGLITLYAGLNYPETFGILGVFSPSVWLDHGNAEKGLEQLKNKEAIRKQHYYFYAGTTENRLKPDGTFVHMSDDVKRVIALLSTNANPEIKLSVNPQGRHGALYWREEFPTFYKWFTELVTKN